MHSSGQSVNDPDQISTQRQDELTSWLNEEAGTFPGCTVERFTDGGQYEYAWKVRMNDVQMGLIILTSQLDLAEDKIRAHFRVELRKILGQPA
jgi:hypothetical protein